MEKFYSCCGCLQGLFAPNIVEQDYGETASNPNNWMVVKIESTEPFDKEIPFADLFGPEKSKG